MSDRTDKHIAHKVARHYMHIDWQKDIPDATLELKRASFEERAKIVGRVGIMLLACGAEAYRVIESMNTVARALDLVCTADVSLTSINYSCFSQNSTYSLALSISTTGVNTEKLRLLELLVAEFEEGGELLSLGVVHQALDQIEKEKGLYTPFQAGLSAGFACGAFTFLLGGAFIEMIFAFIGAFFGNWLRRHMLDRRISLIPTVMASVALACLVCISCYLLSERFFSLPSVHEAGYICSMLFIVPGFPLITGGLDLAKSEMRSGIERISYALVIIIVATFIGWAMAQFLSFQPADLVGVNLSVELRFLLRLIFSFVGVFGFSQMFNSSPHMAASAAFVGAIANTARLELIDLAGISPALAAFIAALVAGLLAAALHKRLHYPRISLSVPSIVIMVPGLYMYRAVYNLALGSSADGATWLFNAFFIVLALPLGLIIARALSDRDFRICS